MYLSEIMKNSTRQHSFCIEYIVLLMGNNFSHNLTCMLNMNMSKKNNLNTARRLVNHGSFSCRALVSIKCPDYLISHAMYFELLSVPAGLHNAVIGDFPFTKIQSLACERFNTDFNIIQQ